MKSREFRLEVVYGGYSPDFDEVIEKVVKRMAHSSGCGFGERDMAFGFKTKRGRDNAMKRLADANLEIAYRGIDVGEDY